MRLLYPENRKLALDAHLAALELASVSALLTLDPLGRLLANEYDQRVFRRVLDLADAIVADGVGASLITWRRDQWRASKGLAPTKLVLDSAPRGIDQDRFHVGIDPDAIKKRFASLVVVDPRSIERFLDAKAIDELFVFVRQGRGEGHLTAALDESFELAWLASDERSHLVRYVKRND